MSVAPDRKGSWNATAGRRRPLRSAAAVAAGGLALVVAAAHADGPTVDALARNCMGCHGEGGISPGEMPTIYGKSKAWTVERLEEFRSGDRASTIMGRIMQAFAEEDIEGLAEYFAARPRGGAR